MTSRSAPAPAARAVPTVVGHWRSDLGSELELHNTDGFLSGRYRSAVGTVRRPEPLIGSCTPPTGRAGAVLAFVVRWTGTGSVTAWTGRHDPRADQLELTWVLENAASSETSWRSTRVGGDVFHRISPPTH
jgi:Avidin family